MIQKTIRRYTELDSGMLTRLFRSDGVYAPSADDYSKPEDVQRFVDLALSTPSVYILGRNPKKEAFVFSPSHNMTTYMAHFAVREDARDGSVVQVAFEAGQWMESHTECKSIVAFMREKNTPARAVLSMLGMRKCGTLRKSVLFNGKYEDEIVYQATLDEVRKIMEP